MAAQLKTLLASTTVTTAVTNTTSDWIDVSEYNELYLCLNVTAFAARVDETLIVYVDRYTPNDVLGYTNVATFTTVNTTGAQSEEKVVNSGTSPYVFGGKIRVRYTTTGTWSSKSITFNVKAYMKNA